MLEMNLKIIGNDIKAEINEGWGNIRLRMTLKINVGCFSLASEMNGGNTRHLFLRLTELRMTLKINVGCLFLFSVGNEWRKHSAPYDAKNKCRVFVFSVGNE